MDLQPSQVSNSTNKRCEEKSPNFQKNKLKSLFCSQMKSKRKIELKAKLWAFCLELVGRRGKIVAKKKREKNEVEKKKVKVGNRLKL